MLLQLFNAVSLIALPLNYSGCLICFLVPVTYLPPYFVFRIKYMTFPFSPKFSNLIIFPTLQSCYDYQGKNTVMAQMEQRGSNEPAGLKELEKHAWNHYQKLPLCPDRQGSSGQLSALRSPTCIPISCSWGSSSLSHFLYATPHLTISRGVTFVKRVVFILSWAMEHFGKTVKYKDPLPRKILRST